MDNPPKHPPHSMEAEMSVLGGLMLRNSAFDEVAEIVTAADFYLGTHRVIFQAISDMANARQPVDFITLAEHLRHSGQLDEAGGISYLGSLANDTPSVANVLHYTETVRERSVMRSLIVVGQSIGEAGFRPDGRSSSELIESAEKAVFDLRQKSAQKATGGVALSSLISEAEDEIQAIMQRGGGIGGTPTGFLDFDTKTDGMHAGDLILIAGRPSSGKTSLAMNIAEHVALRLGKRVGIFSMEMPGRQLAMRTLAGESRVPLGVIRAGKMDTQQFDRFSAASGRLRSAPMVVDDTGGLSPLDIRARARRMMAQGGLSLMVVDYIQLMHVPGSENRTNEVAEISRNLKSLAKELNIPIIALSQLNRGVEARPCKRPRMSDLRDSGGLEQDADLVALIYRDEIYNEHSKDKGIAEIIIGKQRNGPLGTVYTAFQGEFCRFDNLAHGYERHSEPEPVRERGFRAPARSPATHWSERAA